MLKAGDKAPAFDLESDQGSRVKLADRKGKRTVVYFYPRDNTPGCTVEAIDFTRAKPKFDKLGVAVYGVSKDSVKSHCGFREKHDLSIELLSDPDLSAHKAFGAFGEKMMYGKKVEGTIRSTFIVGADGKVEKVFSSVKVSGHVDAVLAALDGKAAAAPAKPAAKAKPAPKAKAAPKPKAAPKAKKK
jgi:peroxiredoxin Q/BCP